MAIFNSYVKLPGYLRVTLVSGVISCHGHDQIRVGRLVSTINFGPFQGLCYQRIDDHRWLLIKIIKRFIVNNG